LVNNWYVGNAADDGVESRGWIMGHFFELEKLGIRSSSALEVKYVFHSAGEKRHEWVTGEKRTTLLLLISGHFHIELSVGIFELRRQGDYAMWGPGIDHLWRAEQDTWMLTIRWPSIA